MINEYKFYQTYSGGATIHNHESQAEFHFYDGIYGLLHAIALLEGLQLSKSAINEFYDQSVSTLVWSECDEDGNPLDDDYNESDISDETKRTLRSECIEFLSDNWELLCETPESYTFSNAGHDFILTRNGHGAGFWDRGLGDIGKRLTEACEDCGSFNLYVGDDGVLYHHN